MLEVSTRNWLFNTPKEDVNYWTILISNDEKHSARVIEIPTAIIPKDVPEKEIKKYFESFVQAIIELL